MGAASFCDAAPVKNVAELLEAVAEARPGTVVEIGQGRFELSAPLKVKEGLTLKGAGMDKTIMTHTADWKADPKTLPDPETTLKWPLEDFTFTKLFGSIDAMPMRQREMKERK